MSQAHHQGRYGQQGLFSGFKSDFQQLIDSIGSREYLEELGTARLETLEIVTDVNQMSDLLSSLAEKRNGQFCSLSDAFCDL